LVHLPPLPSSQVALPMITSFHTMAETAEMMESLTHMSDLADREQIIVVYPEGLEKANVQGWLPGGIGHTWNGGTCCPKETTSKVDDVQFTKDLLKVLPSKVADLSGNKLTIDERRVYATGGSNGAFMVNRIACQAPSLFAAVAPVGGLIGNGSAIVWSDDPFDCPPPPTPLPVLHFHGILDPLVPWLGNPLLGFSSVSTYKSIRKYLAHVPDDASGTTSFKNGSVECTTFGGMANNFTFCKHGSGHCWPGSTEQGSCTLDIDATEQIWQFFRRYTLPVAVELA